MNRAYEFQPAPERDIRNAEHDDVLLGYGASFGKVLENPNSEDRSREVEYIYDHAYFIGGLALELINRIYERTLNNVERPREAGEEVKFIRPAGAEQDMQAWPVPNGDHLPSLRSREEPPAKRRVRLEFMPRQDKLKH